MQAVEKGYGNRTPFRVLKKNLLQHDPPQNIPMRLQKTRTVGIAALIVCLGLITLQVASQQPANSLPSKSRYRTYAFDQDPWLASFNQEYQAAQRNQSYWLQDPIKLALKVAGYPNADGVNPDEIHIYYTSSTTLTAIIRNDNLEDDAIAAEENRVDLVYTGAVWEIAWAGGRWKCSRVQSPPSLGWLDKPILNRWTDSLCS